MRSLILRSKRKMTRKKILSIVVPILLKHNKLVCLYFYLSLCADMLLGLGRLKRCIVLYRVNAVLSGTS